MPASVKINRTIVTVEMANFLTGLSPLFLGDLLSLAEDIFFREESKSRDALSFSADWKEELSFFVSEPLAVLSLLVILVLSSAITLFENVSSPFMFVLSATLFVDGSALVSSRKAFVLGVIPSIAMLVRVGLALSVFRFWLWSPPKSSLSAVKSSAALSVGVKSAGSGKTGSNGLLFIFSLPTFIIAFIVRF